MNEELTPEQIAQLEETVERRNKLFEAMKQQRIDRIRYLAKRIEETERIAANKKTASRKKAKVARKARKLNRRK